MRIRTAICISAIVLIGAWQIIHPGPAKAFMTFWWFGGAIHQQITREALAPLGVSEESLHLIGKGTDSQDTPFSFKYSMCPENHADDNRIPSARSYIRSRITQAVSDALIADTDKKQRDHVLYEFGEAMHTVQDFYSHANYLEWLLRNHKALEPIDWDNVPPEVCTGYYFYERPFDEDAYISRAKSVRGLQRKYQHLNFHSAEEFEARIRSSSYEDALNYALAPYQFLHKELNKDNPKSIEGRVVAPEYNKTLHELARELATADTARQWKTFEEMITETYGVRSPDILSALKQTDLETARSN
jgi:hypothetical protein